MQTTVIDRHLIVIVDPNRSRYQFLTSDEASFPRRLVFCARGDDALRQARLAPARFYVVHVSLPDMSGFDLVALLEQSVPESRFALIADRYDVNDERRAFQLRRTKYLSPPLDEMWLPKLLAVPQEDGIALDAPARHPVESAAATIPATHPP